MNATEIAQLGCGLLFTIGLLTGFWKYRRMITSPDGQAPTYVDICHRTALMYAFASLVLVEFAGSRRRGAPVLLLRVGRDLRGPRLPRRY